jgi:hypothetical protein
MPRASWRGFVRFFIVLPDLFAAGDDTDKTHSLAPGGNQRRPMWTRTICRIGDRGGGQRVLRDRYRGS